MFIDYAKAHIKAGNGGDGVVSFRREKFVPLGGPNGGDGGRGGDVLFLADRNMNTLIDFKFQPNLKAKDGVKGQGSNKTGKSGKTVKIRIPVGTIIKHLRTEEVIYDFVKDGESFVVARGGKGGLGNQHFATSSNHTPRKATLGEKGDKFDVSLELKLIAEVGLVGFPNAGKSTFLSVVSEARPKVANYPFTTLSPSLGVAKVDGQDHALLVADIPGLIEGAHQNKGLGIQFLKHIERTKVLLFVLDMAGTDGRSPMDDFKVLKKELSYYAQTLLDKEVLVAANKMDVPEAAENLSKFNEQFADWKDKVHPISAVTQEGIKLLLRELHRKVSQE